MKKTLVALAALASVSAFAQSTVTLSGIVDLGYQNISNLGGQNTSQVGQNGARTSTFKFNGVEDLGGGMNANFQFEVQPSYIAADGNKFNASYPATTANAAVAAGAQSTNAASAQSGLVGKGQSFIGLTDAKLGTVQFGTINTATFGAYAAVSQLGTGIGSGYGSGNTFGDFTRVESSVAYKSPVINGFDVSLLRGTDNESQFGVKGSTGTGVTLRRPTVTDIGVGYTNGPVAVKFGRLASKATAAEASGAGVVTTTQMLGGAYNAGFAKFSLGTGSVKAEGGATSSTKADYKLTVAAVTVPFGANRVIAQTGSLRVDNGASTSVVVGAKAKTSGIALERDLSKRTFAYLRYENTDLGGYAAGAFFVNGAALSNWNNGSTRKITSVGISHSF
jgi:predicted porin